METPSQLALLTPAEQFCRVARQIVAISDPAKQGQKIAEVFGSSHVSGPE